MPLNSPTHNTDGSQSAGVLYVVATPIGHMEDITLRALKVLKQVDTIAAEDTRHTHNLLTHYGIATPLVSYHEHNERTKTPVLTNQLAAGKSIALVTDAGTPGVSDPGYRLVAAAVERGISVVPVPGVSAVITALSASGLATDAFVFVGFPAKKAGRRKEQLQALSQETKTLIFYESPKRILNFLSEIQLEMGDRNAVLSREMTKLHEEFLRGRVSGIFSILTDRPVVKGECTLLIAGREEANDSADNPERMHAEIASALAAGGKLSDVSRDIAQLFGVPRRTVYDLALKLKDKGYPHVQ
ncbi:MAG: 16S rRNA (cytidine(1402)-2'-O)-methyltransferase [Desulfobacterales bacterium]|jgi:16S rRNA (cytidine1402-2'-O)-methyltransferase|nr:16S rRNA (cytidine(1402)-2'-O)-methyltransferase [Desulfobacterales bacterium]